MANLRYRFRLAHLLVETTNGQSVQIPWLDLVHDGHGYRLPESQRQANDSLPKRITCLDARALRVIRRLHIRAMKAQLATGNYQRDWECKGICPPYLRVLQTLAGIALFGLTCQRILEGTWWSHPEVLRQMPMVALIALGAITVTILAGLLAMALFPWSRWMKGNVARLTTTSCGLDAQMLDGRVNHHDWGDLIKASEMGSLTFRGSHPVTVRPRMRGGPGGEHNDWLLLVAAVRETVLGRKSQIDERRRRMRRLARGVRWVWFPGVVGIVLLHWAIDYIEVIGLLIAAWTLAVVLISGAVHFSCRPGGLDRLLRRYSRKRAKR